MSRPGGEGARAAEIASVRFLVSAPPWVVGQAVAQSLLQGMPGFLHRGFCEVFPLPEPVAPEWEEVAGQWPQYQAENVRRGGTAQASVSFSLGLRPLFWDEFISPCSTKDGVGYCVELRSGRTSWITAEEITGRPYPERRFDVKVYGHHPFLPAGEEGAADHLGISSSCIIQSAHEGKCAEITRRLLKLHGLQETQGEHAAAAATNIIFMLEMEVRAWLSHRCLGLVEVWRGVRRPDPWLVTPVLQTTASYALGAGHAGASAVERADQAEGPLFNVAMARKLSAHLPDVRNEVSVGKGREYTEGNVNVESFAALIDRVSRRSEAKADIFRCFADLGSGRGHAVLAAHALFPFRECVGCELVPEVVEAAKASARTYVESGLAFYALSKSDPAKLFVQGDFTCDLDWSNASLVFANAVTWPKALVRGLAKQALRLQKGAVLLMAVKSLPTEDPELLEVSPWGAPGRDQEQAFDIRGEAVLTGFMRDAVRLWAYQRR